jgi:hypothetical protein
MVERECEYVPGLYKIFDEILVNAADNKQRDPRMDTIKVDIDVDSGTISIMNNGTAVPVQMHSTEQVYVPELIFGHLLTGSNFDDDETKVTGGRNGFGAKLANIFSVSSQHSGVIPDAVPAQLAVSTSRLSSALWQQYDSPSLSLRPRIGGVASGTSRYFERTCR